VLQRAIRQDGVDRVLLILEELEGKRRPGQQEKLQMCPVEVQQG